MTSVSWALPARIDLSNIFNWAALYGDDVAAHTIDRIEAKAAWLADFPMTGSPFYAASRKSRVAGTRYLLIYRPVSTGIQVLRIYHERQDWRRS